jgi:hypothetical protein
MLLSASMRAYKFLDAHFGLKSLYEKRLKISEIHELNDPFELTPYDLTDQIQREAFLNTRDQLGRRFGMLCFSGAWSDPVIWAHYSDKHKGICLGFEIPRDKAKAVYYASAPRPFPANFLDLASGEKMALVQEMLFTKYSNWDYEHEIRVWAQLDDEEDGFYFAGFGEELRLVEVITGARCTLPTRAITRALEPLSSHVTVIKARAAHDAFRVVQDQ